MSLFPHLQNVLDVNLIDGISDVYNDAELILSE